MNSLFVLIPVALLLLGVAIWAFVWAVDHAQFDDLEDEAERILFEHDPGENDARTGRSE
jgi:cbb3-type cytochrome oxidase maturation protein